MTVTTGYQPENPLIVQGDHTILAEVASPHYAAARDSYSDGEALPLAFRVLTRSGLPFSLRPYQLEAAAAFHAGGTARGGSGVITLPCGAGKTIVAMACMERLATSTLVLTTSVTAARQWIAELLDKTTLTEEQIAEYTGDSHCSRPRYLNFLACCPEVGPDSVFAILAP